MKGDLRRALARNTPAFSGVRDAAAEIVLDDDHRHRRYMEGPRVDQGAIERAAAQAVTDALAEQSDARIVVVNVNIQIASGGGATNQIGSQPSANNRWGRDR